MLANMLMKSLLIWPLQELGGHCPKLPDFVRCRLLLAGLGKNSECNADID